MLGGRKKSREALQTPEEKRGEQSRSENPTKKGGRPHLTKQAGGGRKKDADA